MRNGKVLTDILPRGIERIEVVQVGESAEEFACTAHLVANHKPVLAATFDLEDLDNGTIPLLDIPHDILVDLQGIRAGLLKEDGIRYSANVSFAV